MLSNKPQDAMDIDELSEAVFVQRQQLAKKVVDARKKHDPEALKVAEEDLKKFKEDHKKEVVLEDALLSFTQAMMKDFIGLFGRYVAIKEQPNLSPDDLLAECSENEQRFTPR